MYYSHFTNQRSKGIDSEERFEKIARSKGYRILETTTDLDKYAHIDKIIMKDSKIAMIDVKSNSKYGFIVELQNNLGYPGWIFGKSDMIAVDRGDNFLIFNREDILSLVKSNINSNEPKVSVSGEKHIPYTIYTRPQWKDRWILVDDKDLLKLKHTIWKVKP